MSLENIKLQRVIQEFRFLDPEMQMQTALAFLLVADRDRNGNITTVSDVGNYLGLSSASASRNVALLSRFSRKGTHGHDLISLNENPARRNEKHIKLTDKGKALMSRLEEYINVSHSQGE